jgi:hemin uptake protein HemP
MNKTTVIHDVDERAVLDRIDPIQRPDGSPIRVFDTRELFKADSEIGIVHNDSLYRLRITRGGKLILNK